MNSLLANTFLPVMLVSMYVVREGNALAYCLQLLHWHLSATARRQEVVAKSYWHCGERGEFLRMGEVENEKNATFGTERRAGARKSQNA